MLWYWGPALAWLCAIALFSSGEFSAANTGSIALHILKFFHIKFSFHTFALVHGLIRKSAHFCVYALLSGLFFRAWRGPFRNGWRWTWMLLALAVCLTTSSSDEIHQVFVPSRTGAANDVLLDMSGALFMQLMIITAVLGKRRN
jgi:VanZ family protein